MRKTMKSKFFAWLLLAARLLTLTLGTYGEADTSSLIALFHEPDTE